MTKISKNTVERKTDDPVMVLGQDGKYHVGHFRIRPIYCGKGCKGCPHHEYKYLVYRDGGKTKEKYLGKVKIEKRP